MLLEGLEIKFSDWASRFGCTVYLIKNNSVSLNATYKRQLLANSEPSIFFSLLSFLEDLRWKMKNLEELQICKKFKLFSVCTLVLTKITENNTEIDKSEVHLRPF